MLHWCYLLTLVTIIGFIGSSFFPKLHGPTGLRNWQSFYPQVPQVWHGKSSRCHKMCCRHIIKSPSQATHTRLPGTSPRECFATVGTMSLNRTMGFWGAKRYTNLIHLADEVVIPCLAMDFLKARVRFSFFHPWKSLKKCYCFRNGYVYIMSWISLPMWPQDTSVQSFQSSSLLAAPWAENVSCSPHCSGARCQRMYARSPTPTVLYFSENWQMASATKTLSNQKSFREEMLFAYLPSNVSKGKDMVAHRPPVESTLSCPTLPPTVPTCKQKLHIRHPNTNSVQDFWPSKVFGKTEGIGTIFYANRYDYIPLTIQNFHLGTLATLNRQQQSYHVTTGLVVDSIHLNNLSNGLANVWHMDAAAGGTSAWPHENGPGKIAGDTG